jgi:lactosylceramide 4-alpha-galactosyltransferase
MVPRFIPRSLRCTSGFCPILFLLTAFFVVVAILRVIKQARPPAETSTASKYLSTGAVRHGNIYFFELSKTFDGFDHKQWCAVESAALHHPGVPIVIGVANPPPKLDVYGEAVVTAYPGQIDIVAVDPLTWIKDALNGTPHNVTREKEEFAKSIASAADVAQTSDYLRYAVLNKHGGIYLDFDVMVLRPLGKLENVLGLQGENFVNQAVVIFEKGHAFLQRALEKFECS